jgi:hypothetical protein
MIVDPMKHIVSPISRGQGNEFLNKLEAAGLNIPLAQKVIDSKGNELAAKVVRLIQNDGLKAPTASFRQVYVGSTGRRKVSICDPPPVELKK